MSDNPISDFESASAAFYRISQNLVQLGNGEIAEMAEPGGESEISGFSPFSQSSYALINHSNILSKLALEMQASSTDITPLEPYVKQYIQGAAKKLYMPSQQSPREAGAVDLLNAANLMFTASQQNNHTEFVKGAGQLIAGSNKYAGGANQFIAAEEYINGAFALKKDTINWKKQNSEANLSTIFTNTHYMNVGDQWNDQGAELYYIGAEQFRLGAELYPEGAENSSQNTARIITGAAENAEISAEIYHQNQFGSAEQLGSEFMDLGGAEMLQASEKLKDGKSAELPESAAEIYAGATTLNYGTQNMAGGAEIYLGGAEEMYGAESYNDGAGQMAEVAAEITPGTGANQQALERATRFIVKGSQNYMAGSAEFNNGAEMVGQAEVTSAEELFNSANTILKASTVIAATADPSNDSAKLLLLGAENMVTAVHEKLPTMEHSARILLKGAEEYVPRSNAQKKSS